MIRTLMVRGYCLAYAVALISVWVVHLGFDSRSSVHSYFDCALSAVSWVDEADPAWVLGSLLLLGPCHACGPRSSPRIVQRWLGHRSPAAAGMCDSVPYF